MVRSALTVVTCYSAWARMAEILRAPCRIRIICSGWGLGSYTTIYIFRVGSNCPESQREFGQILADVTAKRPFCQKGASLVNSLLNAIGSIHSQALENKFTDNLKRETVAPPFVVWSRHGKGCIACESPLWRHAPPLTLGRLVLATTTRILSPARPVGWSICAKRRRASKTKMGNRLRFPIFSRFSRRGGVRRAPPSVRTARAV